jgi:hypothetical protein
VQALPQQTPSTQNPVPHCAFREHCEALGSPATHWPFALHQSPATHWESAVHEVGQLAPAPVQV